MATDEPSYEEHPEVKRLHQALGLYMAEFSEIAARMRTGICAYISKHNDLLYPHWDPMLDILFANMTASPLANAFFAMSTEAAQLHEDELSIRNALKKNTMDQIEFRNQLAHAEWDIGWSVDGTGELIPPFSRKITSQDGIPRLTNLGIGTDEIWDHIYKNRLLYETVRLFTLTCRKRQLRYDAPLGDVLEIRKDPGKPRVFPVPSGTADPTTSSAEGRGPATGTPPAQPS